MVTLCLFVLARSLVRSTDASTDPLGSFARSAMAASAAGKSPDANWMLCAQAGSRAFGVAASRVCSANFVSLCFGIHDPGGLDCCQISQHLGLAEQGGLKGPRLAGRLARGLLEKLSGFGELSRRFAGLASSDDADWPSYRIDWISSVGATLLSWHPTARRLQSATRTAPGRAPAADRLLEFRLVDQVHVIAAAHREARPQAPRADCGEMARRVRLQD